MKNAYICDAVRTPFGRYGGSLSSVRADDLGAIPIKALLERNTGLNPSLIDDVFFGCANQAGEDNRNIARMSLLLAGLPTTVPGMTINRLCGSGMDAVGTASRAIKSGEANLIIAGGVESMSRAPFVMGKADSPFSRNANGLYDTTIGWRFINDKMDKMYGVESMPETAENVAEQFNISRADQDLFALRSQQKAQEALKNNVFKDEIVPVSIEQRKGEPLIFAIDEHPRSTSLEILNNLRAPFRNGGSVTAGNASGINDGACALIIASDTAIKEHSLQPRARIVAMATVGIDPSIMGFGPAPACEKVLRQAGLTLDDMDVIELNEAFASQALAVTRHLKLSDDDVRINPNGGAIALGHPLGASGARLISTASYELNRKKGKYALCAMCIGVGQGIAIIIERV